MNSHISILPCFLSSNSGGTLKTLHSCRFRSVDRETDELFKAFQDVLSTSNLAKPFSYGSNEAKSRFLIACTPLETENPD